jgi:putative nmeDIP very short patch repair endonuclease
MANTKEQISRNMKSNKGKDTKPELLLRKELWRRGLRYRKNYKELYGKPDIVFLGARIAVFVDGKMWHGYDWEHQKDDFKSRRDYWIPKIERNIEHDYEVTQELISLDWLVMRFWDFEIKKNLQECADKIERAYNNRKNG